MKRLKGIKNAAARFAWQKIIMVLFALLFFASLSMADFDDLGFAARPAGMGNAFVSIADDANAVYYNPSALAFMQYVEVTAGYSRMFVGLSDQSNLGNGIAAIALPFGDVGTFGLGWVNLNLLSYYQENTLIFSYARRIFSNVAFGFNVKLLIVNYGQDAYTALDPVFIEKGYSKYNFSADLSMLWKFCPEFGLGIVVTDANQPDLGLKTQDTVPYALKVGLGYMDEAHDLNLAVDCIYKQKDLSFYSGIEKWFGRRQYAVRAGMDFGSRNERNLTVGAGVSVSAFELDYAFLYTLGGIKNTYGSHRMSFTVKFGEVISKSEQEEIKLKDLSDRLMKANVEMNVLKDDLTAERETSRTLIQKLISEKDELDKELQFVKLKFESSDKTKDEMKRDMRNLSEKVEDLEKALQSQRNRSVSPALPVKTYVVQKGDTLKSIAQMFYNDVSKWNVIYNANKKAIGEGGTLVPGVKLVIP